MNRAHPVLQRKCMEAAQALTKQGIAFVPMPVLSADDHDQLVNQMLARLEQLAQQAEAAL
jgi:hypothetical protein